MSLGFAGVESANSAAASANQILPGSRCTFQVERDDVASGLELLLNSAQSLPGSSGEEVNEDSKVADSSPSARFPAKGGGGGGPSPLSDLRSARNLMFREQEKEPNSLTLKIRAAVRKVAEQLDAACAFSLDNEDEFHVCAE